MRNILLFIFSLFTTVLIAQSDVCNLSGSDCFLVCPGDQKATIDGREDSTVDVPCGHSFVLPDLYNFNTNGHGFTGDCDATATIEVLLTNVSFVDAGFSSGTATDFDPDTPVDAEGSNEVQLNFPGQYDLVYTLIINGEATACCSQSVYVRVEQSIACNNQISVSMGPNCLAFITLDMLLEGNVANTQNLCAMDFYSVSIPGSSPSDLGDGIYEIDDPGKYVATVTSPTGETCETSILVEDKVNAVISCPEITDLKCTQSVAPGDPILNYECETISSNSPLMIGPAGSSGEPNLLEVAFDWTGLDEDNKVDELIINLDVMIDQVQDVRVWLVSPDNPATAASEQDTLMILDLVSGNSCVQPNFSLELDDDHFLSHNQLVALGCDLGNNKAYCGDYKPLNPLSFFDGYCAAGEWKLLLANFSTTETLSVDPLSEMCLTYTDGSIPFPYGDEENIVSIGDNCFEISFENDNCGPYTACYEDELTQCVEDILSLTTFSTISRTWTVNSGTSESSCVQTIALTRCDLDDLECPPDYDGSQFAPFLCTAFITTDASGNPVLDTSMLTSEGHPSPNVTGYPESQFGDINLCFGYEATFSDTKLEICGELSFKVLRDWRILDWCTGEILQKTQIIKVIDIEAPVVVAPEDGFTANTDGADCTATWDVIPPVTVFDCGFVLNPGSYNYTVGYLIADSDGNPPVDGEYLTDENVVDTNNDGFPDEIRNLPEGRTWIRYMVTDDCGNVGFAFTEIDVFDSTPPIAVGIDNLVVSLNEKGMAIIEAESFDAESHDNCGSMDFMIRRVDIVIDSGDQGEGNNNDESDDGFDDRADFDCRDLTGEEIEMEMMVTDGSGNTSVASVNVTVQNPFAFDALEIPEDITIDCTASLPNAETIEESFFQAGTTSNCELIVLCEDPKELSPIDGCGNGRYLVECTVTATGGDVRNVNYEIEVVNATPFSVDDIDWTPVAQFNDQILETCPAELILDGNTDELGYPGIPDDPCNLLAVNYEDQVFQDVENVCIKILRTWTVIDWCTYVPNGPSNEGIATFVQILKINDNEGPFITCDSLGGSIIAGPANTGNSCFYNTLGNDPEGILILDESEGNDLCDALVGKEVTVAWDIDWHGDGNGGTDGFDDWGPGRDANGEMPYGCHIITWYLDDCCGNRSSCSYEVCVEETQAPQVRCVSSAIVVLQNPADGPTQVWADMFNDGTTDNVTGTCNENELSYSLTHSGTTDVSLSFTCDDIPNGVTATYPVQVTVTDEFGNSDFCETFIILQDNQDYCSDNGAGAGMIAGQVYTEESLMVDNAMVRLESEIPWFSEIRTENGGLYSFENVPLYNNYTLEAEKEDNHLNGVSTLDLVLIQQHILGLEELSSSYKIIAADADDSGSVTAVDLIALRKIILGVESTLPNEEMPWRFIPEAERFDDLELPFPYSQYLHLLNVQQSMMNNDFIAVKVGDVNGSAIVNTLGEGIIEERSAERLELWIKDENIGIGETQTIPVYARNFDQILGMQMTIESSSTAMKLESIQSGAIEIVAANVGTSRSKDGLLTLSWNKAEATSVDASEPIFEIIVAVDSEITLSEAIDINSSFTTAEVYNSNQEIMDVNLSFENEANDLSNITLYQNRPNPFEGGTTIEFKTYEAEDMTLNIYNLEGKLVKTIAGNYASGMHQIVVKSEELEGPGIYYYELTSESYTKTMKMISL